MNAPLYPFQPDWVISPGDLLRLWMEEAGVDARVLAVACGGSSNRDRFLVMISEVLDRKPLSAAHAHMLAHGTGIPARLWLAFEANYRNGLAAGLTDASEGAEREGPGDGQPG